MTWPSPEARRAGSRARVTRITPRTLASHMPIQSSSQATSTRSSPRAPPALLTSRWTAAGSREAKASTLPAWRTSSSRTWAPSGSPTSRRRSRRRAPSQSSKPAPASARAAAAPMPELAPVTTAIFPAIIGPPRNVLLETISPLDLRRRAEVRHRADGAFGLAGLAGLPAVILEQQGEARPLLARQEIDQIPLDLLRVLLLGEEEPAGEALDVGVHGDPLVAAEGVPQHHVGRLPPHPGERHQGLHGVRHLAAVLGHEGHTEILQGPRLVAVETGLADHLLQLREVRRGEVAGRGVAPEERRGDLVDLLVRALGGQDGRHQELEGALEVEGDPGPRKLPPEPRQDLRRALPPRPLRFPPCLGRGDAGPRHYDSLVNARTSQLTSAIASPPRIAGPQPLTCRVCGRSQAASQSVSPVITR